MTNTLEKINSTAHIAMSRESGLVLDVERAGNCGTYRTRMLFYFVDVPASMIYYTLLFYLSIIIIVVYYIS